MASSQPIVPDPDSPAVKERNHITITDFAERVLLLKSFTRAPFHRRIGASVTGSKYVNCVETGFQKVR